jgi:hypothetical protein
MVLPYLAKNISRKVQKAIMKDIPTQSMVGNFGRGCAKGFMMIALLNKSVELTKKCFFDFLEQKL